MFSTSASRLPAAAVVGLALATGGTARAQEPDVTVSGRVQSDIRFRLTEATVGGWYNELELPSGVARNENLAGLTVEAGMDDVSAVADIDLVLYGLSNDIDGLGALARREEVDPYRFDIHQLYFQVQDLLVDGLDLRVGQQLVMWGVGDQFNPTNNINPDDLEDPLRFGDQAGNVMARLDYWINEEWSLTGVLVPVFKPALLPRTAPLGVARLDRVPIIDDDLRLRVQAENAASGMSILNHPTIVASTSHELPDTSFENMQFAYRIGGNLFGHDLSLSYYRGRWDLPVARANHTIQNATPQCNPNRPTECVDGTLETDVLLTYPKMHVYGFNATGEISWLREISEVFSSIGYRLEGALMVPQQQRLRLTNDELNIAFPQPAGEYDYDDDGQPGGREPLVVDDTPFLKWVFGLDYTFGEHVYANVQWVHGLVDEYGAGDFITEGWQVVAADVTTDATDTTLGCALNRDGTECVREIQRPKINDYLVVGVDLRFLENRALVRIFNILYLNGVWIEQFDPARGQRVREHKSIATEEGFSMVIFPEVSYNFGNGLELAGGALVQLGKDYSRFGDPQGGGSLAWTRGRYSF
ncbi:MAG: hypothetical protein JRI23_32325 [Deltaproteobacteria bacterium]|jgi:hypothetical protein|nr:hypothetical protein [Deltaproteobacteria bacterium]MBW2536931.1 hypothetical protein [Deltaproteobacteria bacterium]